MPQVDLEILVPSVSSGGSDRKIGCETLAGDPIDDPKTRPDAGSVATPPQDFPPESYFLSKEDQIEWLSQNAFFERKESQKGNSTSNSNPGSNFNPNSNPGSTSHPNSNSQRISLKPKASIFGLPKPQKTCFNEAKSRRNCRIAKALLIPKRVGSRLKSDPSLSEPSSPKVSCMGRVRSKRDRSHRIRRQKSVRSNPVIDNPNRSKKPGFLASFRAIFRTGGGCKDVSSSARGEDVHPAARDIRNRLPPDDVDAVSAGPRRSLNEPVRSGLGGMNRFASGRRADLLVDVDVA
ncbi:PREDICTED: uncharacterized protein LOC104827508 [Tarenaya hassleriana]|uniref:uncharacterized protein LOC104827508 n=1 Tax=Tarenaya hassleriana TaxID=28532 RepID=UPI00053C29F8|nr:PREDICTED: uncharacterized protein LOC104827508 [Tarenaya hassleriana]